MRRGEERTVSGCLRLLDGPNHALPQADVATGRAALEVALDEAIPTDPAPILALAPELDERFFAVPKILDEK